MSENIILYKSGQIIRDKCNEYRGLIVQADDEYRASEAWYEANAEKSPKNQAWYHILVSEINQIAYVAQSSILPDESCQPIDHPLIPIFFHPYQDGHYPRNDRIWPDNHIT